MKLRNETGFTLIEIMITVAIVAILAAVALPSYRNHLIKASRVQAQTEMLDLASLQEKIYLNANSYSPSVTTAYNGTAAGGLGRTTGQTKDGKYTLALTMGAGNQTFVLTATPAFGGQQVGDGNLSISDGGQRLWVKTSGTTTW